MTTADDWKTLGKRPKKRVKTFGRRPTSTREKDKKQKEGNLYLTMVYDDS